MYASERCTLDPCAKFSRDEENTEEEKVVYRLVVDAVRRWLRQAGGSTPETIDDRRTAHHHG